MAILAGSSEASLRNTPKPSMHINLTMPGQCQQLPHHINVPSLTGQPEASLGPVLISSVHVNFTITCQRQKFTHNLHMPECTCLSKTKLAFSLRPLMHIHLAASLQCQQPTQQPNIPSPARNDKANSRKVASLSSNINTHVTSTPLLHAQQYTCLRIIAFSHHLCHPRLLAVRISHAVANADSALLAPTNLHFCTGCTGGTAQCRMSSCDP